MCHYSLEACNALTPVSYLIIFPFISEIQNVFDLSGHGDGAFQWLLSLGQGTRSMEDFSVIFRTLAVDSGWNEEALLGVFLRALSKPIKDELVLHDAPANLNYLISLAIRLDNQMREKWSHSFPPSWLPLVCPSPVYHQESQAASVRITPEEAVASPSWRVFLLWTNRPYSGKISKIQAATNRQGSSVRQGVLVSQTSSLDSPPILYGLPTYATCSPCYTQTHRLLLLRLLLFTLAIKLF